MFSTLGWPFMKFQNREEFQLHFKCYLLCTCLAYFEQINDKIKMPFIYIKYEFYQIDNVSGVAKSVLSFEIRR